MENLCTFCNRSISGIRTTTGDGIWFNQRIYSFWTSFWPKPPVGSKAWNPWIGMGTGIPWQWWFSQTSQYWSGYVSLYHVAPFATSKNFSHRVYLGEGIYGEVTLLYRTTGWELLPWTYPDYKILEVQTFLSRCRESLKQYIRDCLTSMAWNSATTPFQINLSTGGYYKRMISAAAFPESRVNTASRSDMEQSVCRTGCPDWPSTPLPVIDCRMMWMTIDDNGHVPFKCFKYTSFQSNRSPSHVSGRFLQLSNSKIFLVGNRDTSPWISILPFTGEPALKRGNNPKPIHGLYHPHVRSNRLFQKPAEYLWMSMRNIDLNVCQTTNQSVSCLKASSLAANRKISWKLCANLLPYVNLEGLNTPDD